MTKFTEYNTTGFTSNEIDTLNAAYDELLPEFGDEMNQLSDRLNNIWQADMTADDLVARIRKH